MAGKAAVYAKKPEPKQKCSSLCKQESRVNNSGSPADRILHLQRTAGNQAVQRLIRSGVLQAKLKIGQPNDMYEQEADRVAEQVMRMPEPQVQRKCAKYNEDEKMVLQAKESPGKAPVNPGQDVPSIVHDVLRSTGQPLDTQTRAFMEPRFGYDFSQVRVHTDARAAESAQTVNALAYTVGRDIILGENQINSKTWQGKRLLAHELAHVVQQEYGLKLIQRQVGSSPDECEDRGPANSEDHPLIYNCQETNNLGRPERERCKRPAVGHAQQLLNEFLRKYDNWKSGVGGDTIACAGGSSAKIEALRNTLPSRLKVDCWFGDLTHKATRMFQLCYGGLKDDGKIGEKTWPALEIVGTTRSPPGKSPPMKKIPPTRKKPPLIPKVTHWQVSAPTHPGWVSVKPTFLIFKSGEPFEFPHFLEVEENSVSGSSKNVTAFQGRYKGRDANISARALAPVTLAGTAATAKFDLTKGEFWYGGKGPIAATTDSSNPVPLGKHEIEIPDFQHILGRQYGDFGTTWFRLGHSGDRYLHPGRISLGCTTITAISEWPNIWKYLISARKDNQSVGELEVVK